MALPRTPLLTARLLLRPYEAADAPDFYQLIQANRDELRLSFPDRLRAVDIPENAAFVLAEYADDWRTGRFYVFGIWQRDPAAYIGDICLMPQAWGQAEIGYYLAQEAQGHGYAREALAAIVPFGFEAVLAKKLLIRCFSANTKGQAVALAGGFALEGRPPRTAWFRSAGLEDDILRYVRKKR